MREINKTLYEVLKLKEPEDGINVSQIITDDLVKKQQSGEATAKAGASKLLDRKADELYGEEKPSAVKKAIKAGASGGTRTGINVNQLKAAGGAPPPVGGIKAAGGKKVTKKVVKKSGGTSTNIRVAQKKGTGTKKVVKKAATKAPEKKSSSLPLLIVLLLVGAGAAYYFLMMDV